MDFSNLTAPQVLEYMRWALMVFDVLLVIATFKLLITAFELRPRFRANPKKQPIMTIRKEEIVEKWNSIMAKFNDGSPDSLKVAVIQGDAMIDGILKTAELEGQHMADRLDNIEPGELSSFEDLWRSHKIRNNVVHSEGFILTRNIAEVAIRGYAKFLKEMKVLE